MKEQSAWRLLGAAAILLLLSGCGGGAPEPPSSYAIEEENLPSLNTAVPLDEQVQYTMETTEEGAVQHRYQNLQSGSEIVQSYMTYLTEEDSCTFLDAEGKLWPEGEDLEPSGTVVAAVESPGGEGLFELSILWDETSCTIIPLFAEGARLPEKENPEGMTLEEAVEYLYSFPPSVLGLEGADMSGYNIFVESGLCMLDGESCLCLNVYTLPEHQYVASYLIAGMENQVYRLDRKTGAVTPTSP